MASVDSASLLSWPGPDKIFIPATITEVSSIALVSKGEHDGKQLERTPFPDVRPPQSHDFTRWRPRYHLMAPRNWMNDPCAPGYNPKTRKYHVGFQWNPQGAEWGNMSWGAAVSSDLLRWDVSETPSMKPGSSVDRCGVFTGAMRATNPAGEEDGQLTCFYTSATSLPIHWTLPYTRGSERIHMATSDDDGRTWSRLPENPIVSGPPPNLDITGWRDPFVAEWKAVDRVLGLDSESPLQHNLYGVVSGGIRDISPATFLYQINAKDLRQWRYVGTLISPGLNFSPSPRWSEDFGTNWEVTNFVTLSSNAGHGRSKAGDFLIFSVEGRRTTPASRLKSDLRASHAQMWMCGEVESGGGTRDAQMRYQYGGMLDHGCFYAANSFWDPVTHQHVAYGWLLEDDLPAQLQKRQGWSGCLSIPRVIQLVTLPAVLRALKSPLSAIGSISTTRDENGTYTVETLAALPDARLKSMRVPSQRMSIGPKVLDGTSTDVVKFHQGSSQWELEASFSVGSSSKKIGIVITHSKAGLGLAQSSERRATSTTIYFEPDTETLTVDRSKSSSIPGVNLSPESAPHTLFTFCRSPGGVLTGSNSTSNPNLTQEQNPVYEQEPLSLHVFCDASVLEIFVNQRTAISTRIYTDSNTCYSIRPFVEEATASAKMPNVDGASVAGIVGFDVWPLLNTSLRE